MSKKWPLHPKPHKYQLLYSWIEDLAKAYDIGYQTFCKKVLGLNSEEISKLRTSLPQNAIIILSKGTGIDIDDLRERELNNMFRKLTQEISEMIKANPGIIVPFIQKDIYKR